MGFPVLINFAALYKSSVSDCGRREDRGVVYLGLYASLLTIGLFLDAVLRPEVKKQIFLSRSHRVEAEALRWQRIAIAVLDTNFAGQVL